MKKIFAFFIPALFICLVSLAQRPAPIKTTNANTNATTQVNPNLKVDPSKIRIADTTYIKINDLQEENQKLSQELSALKATVNTLTGKITEMQKDVGALKFVMVGVDKTLGNLKKLSPVAYASFEPQKGATGGYEFKLASQYGIKGTPVQIYSSLTITLDRNIAGKPVIVTAAGEDHVNAGGISKTSTVIYDFTAPNKIRLTLKGDAIAPFSFVVYEAVD